MDRTPAQKWAQERNTTKGQIIALASLATIVRQKRSTVDKEQKALNAIINVLGMLEKEWKDHAIESKEQYLRKLKS